MSLLDDFEAGKRHWNGMYGYASTCKMLIFSACLGLW